MKTPNPNGQPEPQVGGSLQPDGSAADLPGCIRREILKIQAENKRLNMPEVAPETGEVLAWQRWSKRLTNQELSEAVLIMAMYCVQDKTCLQAKLREAARRLRQNGPAQTRPDQTQ